MGDSSACAHNLHVTGFSPALIAQVVGVTDGAFAHIGDDFHVTVRMLWKARTWRDNVVVPHAKVAPVHALGVVVFGEREVVMGIKPAMVGAAQGVERSKFKHDRLLLMALMIP
jgi:hypothetical protein